MPLPPRGPGMGSFPRQEGMLAKVQALLAESEAALQEAEAAAAVVAAVQDPMRVALVRERAALHNAERRVLALGPTADETPPPEPFHPDRERHERVWRTHWLLQRDMHLPSRRELVSGERLPSPADDPALAGVPLPETVYAARCLLQHNFAVLDNFWPDAECRQMRAEMDAEWKKGGLTLGKLGRGALADSGPNVTTMRSDLIAWREGGDPGTAAATRYMENRADVFTQKLAYFLTTTGAEQHWDVQRRSKMMMAVYPGDGAHYVKHHDNPNCNGRKVTLLLYLNEDWRPEHGGVLRIGRDPIEHPARPYWDIAPIMGRAVLFWSDRRCPHEVAPCWRPRYTLTLWYLDDEEREAGARRAAGATEVATDARDLARRMADEARAGAAAGCEEGTWL
eukprot:TRINITY_DN123_c0_g1_i1.p1 TRINITY_DN123_c0_g1~~TRINITY_DN123_c0_g1_i1.p1  ORF type:complete len:415 (+),score=129.61 TRINITY_DN123_c0_g1_i1:61-1245(+)